MLDKSGLYIIVNSKTGDYYIGSAKVFAKRFSTHLSLLKSNKHSNIHLQRAWNKYGESNFVFKIILICNEELRKLYEQLYLDVVVPSYNISTKATGFSGKVTELMRESARKTGLSQKGKRKPKTYSDRLSKRMIGNKLGLGRKMSEENKLKLKNRNLGNKYYLGKKHTQEYKQYMSQLNKGKVFSDETRKKMSVAAKLRVQREKLDKERRGAR